MAEPIIKSQRFSHNFLIEKWHLINFVDEQLLDWKIGLIQGERCQSYFLWESTVLFIGQQTLNDAVIGHLIGTWKV